MVAAWGADEGRGGERLASQAENSLYGAAPGRRLARSRNREEPGEPDGAGEGAGA